MKTSVDRKKLPAFFKPILWSYDFSKIDIERDKHTIIVNALNYGDLTHWRWLVDCYGKEEIQRVIGKAPATEFRSRVRPLIQLLFNVRHFNYALRGTGRKA